MKRYGHSRLLTFTASFALSLILALSSFQAESEDIDIFSVDQDQTVNTPNVLIILDNSANWARQAQQWPSAATQGQSEVKAIKEVIVDELPDNAVNVGLLEYRTQGANNNDNGYVRYHIRPMNSTNKVDFGNILFGPPGSTTPIDSSIFSNINAPIEKRQQGNPFGNLMWEAYNYLGSLSSIASPGSAGEGTPPPPHADPGAYDSQFDLFRSPLTSTDSCTRTIIIFIGNNTQQGPTADSQDNETALSSVGGSTDQLPFAEFAVSTTVETELLGYSTACYPSIADCTSAEDAFCTGSDGGGYDSCECIEDGANPADDTCTVEQFTVFGQNNVRVEPPESTTTTTTSDTNTGEASLCQNNDPNPLSCPSQSVVTVAGPGADQETETTTTWTNCLYDERPNTCGNNDNKTTWVPIGDKDVTEKVYDLTVSNTELGLTGSCTADANSCDTSAYTGCTDGSFDNCFCDLPSDATGCSTTNADYQVRGTFTSTEATATGNFVPAPDGPFMADEWARFLRNQGVPLPGGTTNTLVTTYTIDVFNAQQHQDFSGLLFNMARVGGGKYFQAKDENQIKAALREILTEVQAVNSAFSSASLPVNATNRAQNENQVFIGLFSPDRQKAPLWFGNLKRYQLIRTGTDIELGDVNEDPAINDITGFITECAVSFWTTDSGAYWNTVGTDDPPAESICGKPGINIHSDLPDGPFVQKGAVSEVLRKGNDPNASPDTDGNYLVNRNIETLSGTSLVSFTDSLLPDVDRDGDSDVDSADAAIKTRVANFIRGEDVLDDDGDAAGTTPAARANTEPRSTIHGDVVHSRPLPVNYGGSTGVVVYYGANDGTYRAVRSSDGVELWSFVAPEHYPKLQRLFDDDPAIRYPGDPLTSKRKDYFFDGSTGIFQTFDANDEAEEVIIFPGMRRGGRMMYAFNVSDPENPSYLWSVGCPNPIGDDTGCTSGFTDITEIGQTWSQANVAFVAGYDGGNTPVVFFGGGYDPCEDADTPPDAATHSGNFCAGAKGSGVYAIDATDGSRLHYFDFNGRSVAADVALIDVNLDAKVDYAYAVDTGGSIYRMDFVSSTGTALAPADWTWTRIAFTDGDSRKFLFSPALFQANATTVFVAIGSGDREHPLHSSYPVTGTPFPDPGADPVVNRFYVFKDNITDTDVNTVIDLDDTNVMQDLTDPANATCTDPGITPAGADAGWFMDLRGGVDPPDAAEPGEQTVTSAVIVGGVVFFSTNRATAASTTACTNSLGEARGYAVNLFNASGTVGVDGICGGDRSGTFTGGGLPPSPVVATVEIDGEVHTIIIGAVDRSVGASGANSAIQAGKVPINIASVRRPVYWFKTGDTD